MSWKLLQAIVFIMQSRPFRSSNHYKQLLFPQFLQVMSSKLLQASVVSVNSTLPEFETLLIPVDLILLELETNGL